ncbi:MAG: chemotaxis protein CheR [Ignavibacteria bacterium CG2_30_36_16]|nr:protein-glutamate O-methyltransferase CheR [Ignavibacteria bacterium]OIP58754.1 MAG: chemotaxis protein CheR [Ignavibacteria bacterium CG2_30_36_16]PJB01482.1 MAG: chemotaxis protein CheR [Ignavibacteria bacterium CG_4_9_14_3_um_filter_36_18]
MNNLSTLAVARNSFLNQKQSLALSVSSFENWRQYIYENCGIYFQDNKKYLLESRLQKRIAFLGLESFDHYLDHLKYSTNSSSEKKYLFEAITINETFFFRNQPQLDVLVNTVMPELIAEKKKSGKNKIRIWSAASSSGEEPYSVAIVIWDLIKPRFPNIEFEIVGTDISSAVLDTAKNGVYKEYSIRNAPAYYLKKYFKQNAAGFEILPQIKNMVSFRLLNLYDTMAMKMMMNFDIIYCANVLIYFNADSKIKVVNSLYNSLSKGGYLFIGYSETLHGISKAFKLISFPKTIGYKKE